MIWIGAKCVVATVNYRLAPEHPYPAAVEDSLETLRWVHEEGPTLLGINPALVALGGSSAWAITLPIRFILSDCTVVATLQPS